LAKVACLNCHTEEVKHDDKIAPDVPELSKAFGGGKKYTFIRGAAENTSTNLTPDPTGLGGWTSKEISNAIAIGKDQMGKAVCAATHGGVISPYAALTDQDLADIVAYIANIPAIANDTAAKFCPAPPIPNAAGAETGAQCGNGLDDDNDTVPDDGCLCGNCQGPPVQ